MYDESIEVCDDEDDNDEEYELLTGRRRAGVSPVRRPPGTFQQQQQQVNHSLSNHSLSQRPSRSIQRGRPVHQHRSSESLGMMSGSGEDDGSSRPLPTSSSQQELQGKSGRKMSTKDFTPQSSQDSGSGKHENLISMASSYAKKLMSSGSEKAKEKPPPDVAEAAKKSSSSSGQHPSEAKRPVPQQQQQPSSSSAGIPPQQQAHQPSGPPGPLARPHSEEEDDEDDDDDDEYDDINMAQIEGLLKRVESAPYPSVGRYIPRPQMPPRTLQAQTHSHSLEPNPLGMHRSSHVHSIPDHGGAGDPYSTRAQGQPPPSASQFHPGFGPATANLMSNFANGPFGSLSEDDSDLEISISEADMDFSRMNKLMEMYTRNPESTSAGTSGSPGIGRPATMDPSMMMSIPSPEIPCLGMVDDEVMENIIAHRRMWEYQLDMKRYSLRRRVLVLSDFHGVHAPDYEVYNPQDYEHLNVSPDIKELFHCITRYEPPMIGSQMDVKLKPFIPEYYPSVGDIDAFIKVVHPEVNDEHMGIKYLDEPSPFQSDPSVLDLRLRALAKQSSSKSVTVKKIDNVGKNAKIIENWIKDISDLHRSKPSPSVHYSKPMPDIDSLIQEWPPQVEDLLKNITLPSAELDCDLPTYVDIVCNLLDIPVYKSRIQALHVLFTLYATYKHFDHYGPLGMGSAGGGGSDGRTDLEHLLPSASSVRIGQSENVDRLQIN